MRPSLRQLARQAASRLRPGASGASAPTASTVSGSPVSGFSERDAAAFAELDAASEALFSSLGAAVTSGWEVMLADLGRALRATGSAERAAAITNKLSDALVPVLSPLQHGERPLQERLRAGVRAATTSGRRADAFDPIVASLASFGGPLQLGWLAALEYVAVILTDLDPSGALKHKLEGQGRVMARLFETQAAALGARLSALGPDLDPALRDVTEQWRDDVVRGLEFAIYDARTALVNAAAKSGKA